MELQTLLETALHACRLNPHAPLLVGVSGGPDSLCLLDALARLGFPVIAAHFDHRLRPESAQDAEHVRAAAGALNVPFTTASADVARFARAKKYTVEEAARELRYRFLFEQARRFSAQAVAVGHTADDQVETILMHLLRGAGSAGLQGMRFRSLLPVWDAAVPLVRPLLAVWRAETLAYCQERGLHPLFDPTNQDVTYFRNRLRHELIPELEKFQPQVRQNLWRTAQILAGEEPILQEAAHQAWDACLEEQGAAYVVLRQPAFQALAPGLQRRVLRQAMADPRDVDFETVERAIRFAMQRQAGAVDLVRGLRLVLEHGRMVISAGELPANDAWPQLAAAVQPVAIPGETALDAQWRLVTRWVEPPELPPASALKESAWEAWIDAAVLAGPLCLRRARPGDRFQPFGMDGRSLKLSDFWINHKLPRRARPAWPLLAAEDHIVWVPGFRLAHGCGVQKNTRKALHVRLFRVADEKE